jgi:imidazolonepropionase
MTANGARALGLTDTGRIAEGLRADLCVWGVASPDELAYAVQPGRLRQRVFDGEITHEG